jgi:RNA recognition motif-containing protein
MGRLFIGNLPFKAAVADLKAFVGSVAEVVDAEIIADRDTGRSKGFGFVELASHEDAIRVKQELAGKTMMGRQVRVDLATERVPGGSAGGR